MLYGGIDPGLKGGIAIVSGNEWTVWPMPVRRALHRKGKGNETDATLLTSLLMDYLAAKVNEADGFERRLFTLERAQTMKQQGIASSGEYMMGWGMIRGVLEAIGIDYQIVTPQVWKRDLGLLGGGKEASLARAKEVVNIPEQYANHDGIAEAILLAEWGIRDYAERLKEIT